MKKNILFILLTSLCITGAPSSTSSLIHSAPLFSDNNTSLLEKPLSQKSIQKRNLNKKKSPPKPKEKPKAKSQEATVLSLKTLNKLSKPYVGLWSLYQHKKNGKVYLKLAKKNLKTPFIYFSMIQDAPLDVSLFRGNYSDSFVFKLKRFYKDIHFIKQNTRYYVDPKSNLSRAKDANISQATFYTATILDEDTHFILLDINGLFKSEHLTRLSLPSPYKKAIKLGGINSKKTTINHIKSYPKNTRLVTNYVFDNPSSAKRLQKNSGITDQRYISISTSHHIVAMPNKHYKARAYSPLVGYFSTKIDDLSSLKSNISKDVIHRWRLIKKDPTAALSKPIKPIVWWIENTTPEAFVPYVKQGVLAWNKAFEAAGFKDALVVKRQPNNAPWDAGDIRYNVIRWSASPNARFGGYGPSVVNPLTGEILASDIMLEYVHFTNRVKYHDLFVEDSQKSDAQYCDTASQLQEALMLGHITVDEALKKRLIQEAMVSLVMHEIGHTLGLTHNFIASHLRSFKEKNNMTLSQKEGLTSSVMDYDMLNLSLDKSKQGTFFSHVAGPYDYWAIAYGYGSPILDKKTPKQTEDAYLKALLDKAYLDQHRYANDAEDMRSSSHGIDPRVMVSDLTNEPMLFAQEQLLIVKNSFKNLKQKALNKKEDYSTYNSYFKILLRNYRVHLTTISRFIGGIYRYDLKDKQTQSPFESVSKEKQDQAMNLLDRFLLESNALSFLDYTFNFAKQDRRSFDLYETSLSPSLLKPAASIQAPILNHVLHPKTLERIYVSEQLDKTTKVSLKHYLKQLRKKIMRTSDKPIHLQLQRFYVDRLISLYQGYPVSTLQTKTHKGVSSHIENTAIKAYIYHELKAIKRISKPRFYNNATLKIHKSYIHSLLKDI